MEQPAGVTSIDDLLKGGSGNRQDTAIVDEILQEINTSKVVQGQQVQKQQQSEQEIMMRRQAQQEQMRNEQMARVQQEQLQGLIQANQRKDKYIQDMQNNQPDTSSSTADLLQEFKPTIIIFILISIFTLPALNKFVVSSIGIEENSIFSILKCFIICIIFFLINKFI